MICDYVPPPHAKRQRLDRDHVHTGPQAGRARGVLCWKCNVQLKDWMEPDWLRRAADYLEANHDWP
jgi:hypothetical protein